MSSALGGSLLTSTIVGGLWFGASGFVLGSGFAVLLTVLHGRRTLEELTAKKAALWGAIVGSAIPVLGSITTIIAFEAPLASSIPSILVNAVLYAALSGSLAAGTVVAAKRAPELSAPSGAESRKLAEPSFEED